MCECLRCFCEGIREALQTFVTAVYQRGLLQYLLQRFVTGIYYRHFFAGPTLDCARLFE